MNGELQNERILLKASLNEKQTIIKCCKTCKETTIIVLNSLNDNFDYLTEKNTHLKAISKHYQKTKITLLSYLQSLLFDKIIVDEELQNKIGNISEILKNTNNAAHEESIKRTPRSLKKQGKRLTCTDRSPSFGSSSDESNVKNSIEDGNLCKVKIQSFPNYLKNTGVIFDKKTNNSVSTPQKEKPKQKTNNSVSIPQKEKPKQKINNSVSTPQKEKPKQSSLYDFFDIDESETNKTNKENTDSKPGYSECFGSSCSDDDTLITSKSASCSNTYSESLSQGKEVLTLSNNNNKGCQKQKKNISKTKIKNNNSAVENKLTSEKKRASKKKINEIERNQTDDILDRIKCTEVRIILEDSNSSNQQLLINIDEDKETEKGIKTRKLIETVKSNLEHKNTVGKINVTSKEIVFEPDRKETDILDESDGSTGIMLVDDTSSIDSIEFGDPFLQPTFQCVEESIKINILKKSEINGTKENTENITHGTKENIENITHGTKENIENITHGTKENIENITHGTKENIENITHGTKGNIENITHGTKGNIENSTHEREDMNIDKHVEIDVENSVDQCSEDSRVTFTIKSIKDRSIDDCIPVSRVTQEREQPNPITVQEHDLTLESVIIISDSESDDDCVIKEEPRIPYQLGNRVEQLFNPFYSQSSSMALNPLPFHTQSLVVPFYQLNSPQIMYAVYPAPPNTNMYGFQSNHFPNQFTSPHVPKKRRRVSDDLNRSSLNMSFIKSADIHSNSMSSESNIAVKQECAVQHTVNILEPKENKIKSNLSTVYEKMSESFPQVERNNSCNTLINFDGITDPVSGTKISLNKDGPSLINNIDVECQSSNASICNNTVSKGNNEITKKSLNIEDTVNTQSINMENNDNTQSINSENKTNVQSIISEDNGNVQSINIENNGNTQSIGSENNGNTQSIGSEDNGNTQSIGSEDNGNVQSIMSIQKNHLSSISYGKGVSSEYRTPKVINLNKRNSVDIDLSEDSEKRSPNKKISSRKQKGEVLVENDVLKHTKINTQTKKNVVKVKKNEKKNNNQVNEKSQLSEKHRKEKDVGNIVLNGVKSLITNSEKVIENNKEKNSLSTEKGTKHPVEIVKKTPDSRKSDLSENNKIREQSKYKDTANSCQNKLNNPEKIDHCKKKEKSPKEISSPFVTERNSLDELDILRVGHTLTNKASSKKRSIIESAVCTPIKRFKSSETAEKQQCIGKETIARKSVEADGSLVAPHSGYKDLIESMFHSNSGTEVKELTSKIMVEIKSLKDLNCRKFVEEILEFLKEKKLMDIPRENIVQTICCMIVNLIWLEKDLYKYYYGLLLKMVQSMLDSRVLIILISINIMVLVWLNQIDVIVSFIVDMLSLPIVPMLLIARCLPPSLINNKLSVKYFSFIALLKLLVTFEFSTSGREEDRRHLSSLPENIQNFWFNGKHCANFERCSDLDLVLVVVRKTMAEYEKKDTKVNWSFLDSIIQKKYN